ncbi:hypothetical protein AEP_02111 [Curvibacter sp. AEP1-3]|jgi:hypothetical protein|nr:hypothetical protein AEP_02111 [Curvibacter sp. AEP1-3]
MLCRWSGALALFPLCALVAGHGAPACAQSLVSSQLQIDTGIGHEAQSAPVFQLTPESTIVYLDDLKHLSGEHVRTSVQASAEWAWDKGFTVSLAGDATLKKSPAKPDLDYQTVSVQPSLMHPLWGGSGGVGVNLQTFDVGGAHFRDSTGLILNWTRADAESMWGVVAEISEYRHGADLRDMDATSRSLLLLRQYTDPCKAISGLDFSAIVGREENRWGYADLSNRSALLSATVHWSMWGGDWSFGRSYRRAVFDESAFEDDPVRMDATHMTDLSAQWPLTSKVSLRVEMNDSVSRSTTRLYDNNFRQFSVTLRTQI